MQRERPTRVYTDWVNWPETEALPGRRPRTVASFIRAFGTMDDAASACIEWKRTGELPTVGCITIPAASGSR
jgi:hypothetical protein